MRFVSNFISVFFQISVEQADLNFNNPYNFGGLSWTLRDILKRHLAGNSFDIFISLLFLMYCYIELAADVEYSKIVRDYDLHGVEQLMSMYDCDYDSAFALIRLHGSLL